MTKHVLKVQLEIPQTPLNLFGLSAQIGQLFWMYLKKALFKCPLSMAIRTKLLMVTGDKDTIIKYVLS